MTRRRRGRFNAQQVAPGLWVGSWPQEGEIGALVDAGIDAVVDVRRERADGPHGWPEGVEVRTAALVDHGSPSVEEVRAAAAQVVELMRAGREVLVHCHAGFERAPTVACAALVLTGWSLRDAYDAVVTARPAARPTEGQLAALRALAQSLSTAE